MYGMKKGPGSVKHGNANGPKASGVPGNAPIKKMGSAVNGESARAGTGGGSLSTKRFPKA